MTWTESKNRTFGAGPEPFEACPDGGRCWHGCPMLPASEQHPEGEGMPCWRVRGASPLGRDSDSWTTEEKVAHGVEEAVAPIGGSNGRPWPPTTRETEHYPDCLHDKPGPGGHVCDLGCESYIEQVEAYWDGYDDASKTTGP